MSTTVDEMLVKLAEYRKQKRRAVTIRTWSEAATIFPDAFEETLEQYNKISKDRVIAFDFKVWLKTSEKVKS